MKMEVRLPIVLGFIKFRDIESLLYDFRTILGYGVQVQALDYEKDLEPLGVRRNNSMPYTGLFWIKGQKPKKKDYRKLMGETE